MLKRVIIRCAICLAMFPGCAFVLAGQEKSVSISARLVDDEVPFNVEAELIVEVKWAGKTGDFTLAPVDPPELTNLRLIATSTSNNVSNQGGIQTATRRYHYSFAGETLGMAYVDEITLRYFDARNESHTLSTPRMQLRIIDPIAVRGDSTDFIIILAAALTILLIGIFVFIKYRNRMKQDENADPEIELQPLEVVFKRHLDDVNKLQESDLGAAYDKLSTITWHYIRQRYELGADVGTTREAIEALEKKEIGHAKRTPIQEILQTCDVARFAGADSDPNRLVGICTLFENLLNQNLSEAKQ